MTDENRRRNLADELARADAAFQSARALRDLELHADSISRAYYAAFHCVRALLFSRGLEPRTHGGAIHLFNTEFVRAGVLPSSHNRLIAGLQRLRELADYDAAVSFASGDAEACLRDAETLRADVETLLRRDGWIK